MTISVRLAMASVCVAWMGSSGGCGSAPGARQGDIGFAGEGVDSVGKSDTDLREEVFWAREVGEDAGDVEEMTDRGEPEVRGEEGGGPGDGGGEVLEEEGAFPDEDPGMDAFPETPGEDPGGDAGPWGCPRPWMPEDGPRWVAVSLPYGPGGTQEANWTLLRLEADGRLVPTGNRFTMGRALDGQVAFSPDGRLGLAAQQDGSIGVFQIDDEGTVQVVETGFRGGFHADQVHLTGDGGRMLVLDAQWAEHGGGIHQVEVRCDGSLVDRGRLLSARLPRALLPLPDGIFLLAARYPEGAPPDAGDTHLMDLQAIPRWLGGVEAFPEDAIVGGAALSPDGRWALIGDISEFSGRDTAIAVLEIGSSGVSRRQVLTPFEDPIALVAAPRGGTFLAASGYGNALFVLEVVPETTGEPIRVRGRLQTTGGPPQLPGTMVVVRRGPLAGRVLVAEVSGIRQVHLGSDGSATDLGVVSLGGGVEGIPGALGVAP